MTAPYADRCPECVGPVASPWLVTDASTPGSPGVRADYVCAGCNHRWFTGWAADAAAPTYPGGSA